LHPGARATLRRGRLPRDLAEHEEKITGPCPFRAGELGSLLERFRVLRDPRCGHGLRHRHPFVLACAATATLTGTCGYQAFEDTCKKFTPRQLKALGCPQAPQGRYAAPSDTTFFRVLTKLDAAHFASVVGAWLLEQEVSVLARLAVDGKVLRGSGRTDGKQLQLLSDASHRLRLTLAHVPIAEKSNEIPALQPLLRAPPSLEGMLLTADALHCQQESARFITQELGGDYLFVLKGNQRGALERAEGLLAQEAFPPDAKVSWEKGHGRLDRRRLKRVAVTPEEIGLCGCWQVIAVGRERIELGLKAAPPSDEIGYYSISLAETQLSGDELFEAIRGHWDAIENGTHHRRDVSFGEDACGVSERGGAQVLTTQRNLALGPYELAQARSDVRPQCQILLPPDDLCRSPGLAAPMRGRRSGALRGGVAYARVKPRRERSARAEGSPVWQAQRPPAAPHSGTPPLPLARLAVLPGLAPLQSLPAKYPREPASPPGRNREMTVVSEGNPREEIKFCSRRVSGRLAGDRPNWRRLGNKAPPSHHFGVLLSKSEGSPWIGISQIVRCV